jgi:hypothetical protein
MPPTESCSPCSSEVEDDECTEGKSVACVILRSERQHAQVGVINAPNQPFIREKRLC